MLEHAIVLNAKEVKQNFEISLYSAVSPEGRKILEKPYDRIINGDEPMSDDRIKQDRERLRKILNPKVKNGNVKRNS